MKITSSFRISGEMNNSSYESRLKLIWEEAENPGHGPAFRIVAVIWLSLCISIGVPANLLVLRAFAKNTPVSTTYVKPVNIKKCFEELGTGCCPTNPCFIMAMVFEIHIGTDLQNDPPICEFDMKS